MKRTTDISESKRGLACDMCIKNIRKVTPTTHIELGGKSFCEFIHWNSKLLTSLEPDSDMEATISKANIKPFVKGLSCLAKVGSELSLERIDDCLILRTLSQAQSSYAQFTLSRSFFSSYVYFHSNPSFASL
jgi:hypothetical protein